MIRALTTGLALTLASACAPTLPESDVPVRQVVDLPETERLDIILVVDDRQSNDADVNWPMSRFSSSAFGVKFALNTRPDHRMILLPSYLPADGAAPRILGDVVLHDAIRDDEGRFPTDGPRHPDDSAWVVEYNKAVNDLVDRPRPRRPAPRAVLDRFLDSEEGRAFRRSDAHLAVFIASAHEDHTAPSGPSVEALADRLESEPFDTTLVMAVPPAEGCGELPAAPHQRALASRLDAFIPRLLCPDMGTYGGWPEYGMDWLAARAWGRQNQARVPLDRPPLDGTLEVTAVRGGEAWVLPSDQWALDRPDVLVVHPPLHGADRLELSWRSDVDPEER